MKKYILLAALSLTGISCSSDGSGTDTVQPADHFDRAQMLSHWADNFITPAYAQFLNKSESLTAAVQAFNAQPGNATLKAVRDALDEAMLSYQYIGFYRFGKAEEVDVNFQFRVNTYPVNTERIEENAISGNDNFTQLNEIKFGKIAQGLPAIDYMVNNFGTTSDEGIIQKFTTSTHAAAYRTYLEKIAQEIKRTAKLVNDSWNSTDKAAFLSNTGNNASTSLNLLSNAYIQYYEKNLRAGKFGYPAGVLTPMYLNLSSEIKPELIESRFSPAKSKRYALEGIKAMQDFYNGKGVNGKTGPSYRQYLEYIAKTNSNAGTIAANIDANFVAAYTTTQGLADNFQTQLAQDPQKMKDVYYILQKNVPLMKVDMAQLMNITVSYMDTDGD